MSKWGILFLFFGIKCQAQLLSWDEPVTDTAGAPIKVTSYRLYYRLITEDPETCEDEKCSELCPMKEEELTHNIEMPATQREYAINKDKMFIPGAMYEMRVAALKDGLESEKSKATVCATVQGLPEEPEQEIENELNENQQQQLIGETENEEINFSGGFIAGSIGRTSGVNHGKLDARLESDRRRDNHNKQISPVLGRERSADRQHDRTRSTSTSVIERRREPEAIQSAFIKSAMAEGPKHLLRDDGGTHGRVGVTRGSAVPKSVRSDEVVSADSAERFFDFSVKNIFIALLLLTVALFITKFR